MFCCCPKRSVKGHKLLFLTRVRSYSAFLEEIDGHETTVTQLPTVTNCELFLTLSSLLTYLADWCSDIIVSVILWKHDQVFAAVLILCFAIIPSLLLNILSIGWWIEDWRNSEHSNKRCCSFSTILRALATFFQLGPVLYYLDSMRFALRFRQKQREMNRKDARNLYLRMLESDRDATLLRLFEAFMESAPQMLIQTYFVGQTLWMRNYGTKLIFQLISIAFSLISLSWALVSQHRCLRFAREDKRNMSLLGSLVQFLWRLFTISSRVLCLSLFVLVYRLWICVFFSVHYLLSIIYLAFCQNIDLSGHYFLETVVFVVAAFVHIFTPFNMTEGATRWRYVWCYTVEVVENAILLLLCLTVETNFPFLHQVALSSVFCFISGIGFLALYYSCFHPNLNDSVCVCGKSEQPNVESAVFEGHKEEISVL